jgi:hypothetical protein
VTRPEPWVVALSVLLVLAAVLAVVVVMSWLLLPA